MTPQEFFQQLDARIAQFDLLCHPFYKAWSAGELSRDDLREYARDYYHHVSAFTTCLAELSMRLEESELRRAVLANLADEKGCDDATGNNPEHSDCDRMNADSHLRALLLGHSLTLQVSGGEVVLGQWQRILMAELDGPRARSLRIQIFGVS